MQHILLPLFSVWDNTLTTKQNGQWLNSLIHSIFLPRDSIRKRLSSKYFISAWSTVPKCRASSTLEGCQKNATVIRHFLLNRLSHDFDKTNKDCVCVEHKDRTRIKEQHSSFSETYRMASCNHLEWHQSSGEKGKGLSVN